MSRIRALVFVALSVPFLGAVAHAAPPVAVTTCHQVVDGGIGILMNDLDCSAIPLAIGVEVHKAKLFLNGHTISGAEIGVACGEKCKIHGPGTITGNTEGIDQFSTSPKGGAVAVFDATVSGNTALGVGGDKVWILRATVDGNGGAVLEGHAIGGGIRAKKTAQIKESSVDGNQTYGVCAPEKIKLVRSTAQGNGTAVDCTPTASCACADLASSTKPKVPRNSTCDTSADHVGGTWGVCSAD